MRNSLSDAHPFSKIIFSLFIILLSFLVTMIIGFLFAVPIFHVNISDFTNLANNYNDPNTLKFLKYLQTIQAIGLFIIPSFIIGYLFNTKPTRYLGFKPTTRFLIILTVLSFFAAIPLINSLAILNESLQLPQWLSGVENWMREQEDNAAELTFAFLQMDNLGSLIFNIIMIGILPSIGEELIFRGVLQRLFTEWTKNIHWGIAIAAILFSALHMQFYGFLPRMVLGVLLGYLFYWSGSIWVPILGHLVNNTTAIIVYYFYGNNSPEEIETFGTTGNVSISIIIGILLIAPLLYLFYKNSNRTTY